MVSECIDCALKRGKFRKTTFGLLLEFRIGIDFAGPIQAILVDHKGNRTKSEIYFGRDLPEFTRHLLTTFYQMLPVNPQFPF